LLVLNVAMTPPCGCWIECEIPASRLLVWAVGRLMKQSPLYETLVIGWAVSCGWEGGRGERRGGDGREKVVK